MSEITAATVKELRERTGAGMMDCKRALTETGGEMESAIDLLRTQGLSAAEKKSGRATADGLIGLSLDGLRGAMVEVNSETDFVARNDLFQDFVRTVSGLALAANGDINALLAASYPGENRSVEDQLTQMIATIGENLAVRRAAVLTVETGVVGSYVHAAQTPGLGKIGVFVGLEGGQSGPDLEQLAKNIAMHVAAANPMAISHEELSADVLDREKKIIAEQAAGTGKPEKVIEKIVEGRLTKFFQEVCLLEQVYVLDTDRTVQQVLDEASKTFGTPITIKGFKRFALGENVADAPST